MSTTILVCPCGLRLKAAGMAAGKSGRCPGCGRALRLPESVPAPPEPATAAVSDEDVCDMLRLPEPAPAGPPPAPAADEDEWNWQGTYDLEPGEPPPAAIHRAEGLWEPWPEVPEVAEVDDELEAPDEPQAPVPDMPAEAAADEGEWTWKGAYDLGADAPAPAPAPDLAEVGGTSEDAEVHPGAAPLGWVPGEGEAESEGSATPDPWWPPRLLYPLRGAEGLAMVSALGGVFWVMGTLIPEYCLGVMADAEKLGTPTMGLLIVLISALPAMVLVPLFLVYGLQYLARVLVAAGDGEPRPPRPPDRNADGLLNGMGSWLLWLVLGASVGLLPLSVYRVATSGGGSWNVGLAAALALVGLPYALLALMMTFLHDDALAARPGAVLGTLARLGPSFLVLSLTVAALFALGAGAFAGALALRAVAFWAYIFPASLACWLFAVWLAIVAMHTLGAYYAPRKGRLKWRRKRLRWGAN